MPEDDPIPESLCKARQKLINAATYLREQLQWAVIRGDSRKSSAISLAISKLTALSNSIAEEQAKAWKTDA